MKIKYKTVSILVIVLAAVFCVGNSLFADNGTPSSGSFRVPKYEKFILENRLTVYLMEQHEVPLIYISVVVPAGAVLDGKQYGLASLTADALLFGTKNYTKAQIQDKLDFLGARYNTIADLETTEITASFAKKDLDIVMPIIKEIVADPVFDQGEFDKRKKRLLLQLEQAKERPASVIRSYFNKFLFGKHTYGNPVEGSRDTVSKITIDAVKTFYTDNYKPAESAVAIVGDFNAAEMKEKVIKCFGSWKADGQSKKPPQKPLPAFNKNRVLLVNKDDATETRFLIGSLGIKRSNPDYVAIQVINTILGGRFTSWLNDELRINAGLTYGAFSGFSAYKDSGTFIVSSFTRTPKTVEALDLAFEVLGRLHKKGVDAKTLESAKNYIKGQYPPRFETAGHFADLLTAMFVYGFDESFINDFQENVDLMTVDKAKQIIEKYFSIDNLQFVLIGKASEIRDKVKKYGQLTEKEIKAEGF